MREFSEAGDGTVLNPNYGGDYMNSTFVEILRAIHKMKKKVNCVIILKIILKEKKKKTGLATL